MPAGSKAQAQPQNAGFLNVRTMIRRMDATLQGGGSGWFSAERGCSAGGCRGVQTTRQLPFVTWAGCGERGKGSNFLSASRVH